MFSPSQPFGGTDAESEGRENCEAEDDVEKVQHCKAPLAAVPDIALGLRKGSIREGVGSRKERVKGTRSVAHRPADALSDVVNCNARNRQPTGIQGFGGGEGSTADPSPPPSSLKSLEFFGASRLGHLIGTKDDGAGLVCRVGRRSAGQPEGCDGLAHLPRECQFMRPAGAVG